MLAAPVVAGVGTMIRNVPDASDTDDTFDAATSVLDDISGDYTLDASHSRLGFSARHAMVTTVRGLTQEMDIFTAQLATKLQPEYLFQDEAVAIAPPVSKS